MQTHKYTNKQPINFSVIVHLKKIKIQHSTNNSNSNIDHNNKYNWNNKSNHNDNSDKNNNCIITIKVLKFFFLF